MPNWIENKVIIIAQKEIIDEIEEHKLSFNYFVPRPNEQDENWYNWNLTNWGVKWDIYDETQSNDDFYLNRIEDDKIELSFLTAWDTPYTFFKNLIKKYEKIYIEVKFEDIDDIKKGVYIISKHSGKIYEKSLFWDDPRGFENIERFNNEEPDDIKKYINITL